MGNAFSWLVFSFSSPIACTSHFAVGPAWHQTIDLSYLWQGAKEHFLISPHW